MNIERLNQSNIVSSGSSTLRNENNTSALYLQHINSRIVRFVNTLKEKFTLSNTIRIGYLTNYSLKILKEESTITNKIAIACLATHIVTILTDYTLLNHGALDVSKVFEGEIWRIATHPILHVNLTHLILNISALRSIGPHVQTCWGLDGFVKIAFLSTISIVAVKILLKRKENSVGLSGVLYAMEGSLNIITAQRNGIQSQLTSTVNMFVADYFFGFVMKKAGVMQVDHLGHICGYIAGLAFALFQIRCGNSGSR